MINSNKERHAEIGRRLDDQAGVGAALKQAAREAVEAHARSDRKIVVWRDNAVVWEDPNGAEPASETDN